VPAGIEAIAVTDHYRIRHSLTLMAAAREAGLIVFPGFEAVTKDGVQFLCLMDVTTKTDLVQARINDCGIHDESELSPIGKYDAREFLEEARKWNALSIAAHVAAEGGGLLRMLKGQARANAWTDANLIACSLPSSADDAPSDLRAILQNKDLSYQRAHHIAIVNCQDVSDPSCVGAGGTSCWIKMSDPSAEGLRQAFLDPSSRIRLDSDPVYDAHAELVAMTWESEGFLRNCGIHFNENLNVLIGGRGTGKSTIIESLRYVLQLEPHSDRARKDHENTVKHVLKTGTKICLMVRSHHPAKRTYVIERMVPGTAIVRDALGSILPLSPADILPHIELFGQHEIADLTHSPEKLTRLLGRFIQADPTLEQSKSDAIENLEHSREQMALVHRRIQQLQDELAKLPAFEESLKRYQEAGVEERLKEQTLLIREEGILRLAAERVQAARGAVKRLRGPLRFDRMSFSESALQELPAKAILSELDLALQHLEGTATAVMSQLEAALLYAEQSVVGVRMRWETRQQEVQDEYAKALRELHKERIDGDEFVQIRRQIERMQPLKEQLAESLVAQETLSRERRRLLVDWSAVRHKEFDRIRKAAKKVNKRLEGLIRVHVAQNGDREPLVTLLRQVGDRLSETADALKQQADLSLTEFVESCRMGGDVLVEKYSLPPSQASRIAHADPALLLQLEELDLATTTRLELNVAPHGQAPVWKALDNLSTGQKATAVLLLLLLESDTPLVADQPEDDLDNRFITEGIVPRVREEKCRRQFILATHNANIPVLGDAELIIGLSAAGEADEGYTEVRGEHVGSIDSGSVRNLVHTVLEGGREAFETRRLKYGF